MFMPLLKYFKSRVLMATFFNNIQTWDMRQSGRERGSSGEVAAQSTTLPHSRFSGHKNTVEQREGGAQQILNIGKQLSKHSLNYSHVNLT